jgi:hypothetical protein
MNVYGRAMTETKRRANSQVVGLVFGPNSQDLPADGATATVQQIAVCSYWGITGTYRKQLFIVSY